MPTHSRWLSILGLPLIVGGSAQVPSSASAIIVRGRVLDSWNSRPVARAAVRLEDGSAGTYTDSTGAFVLRAPRPSKGRLQLKVLFIGYHPSTVDRPLGRDSVQDIGAVKLEQMPVQLEDLVVTGHPPDTAAIRKRKATQPKKP